MATAPSPPILIWQPGGGVPGGPISNPPVYSQSDVTQLVMGQAYVDVVFGSVQTSEDWVLVTCEVENTTDLAPLNIWPGIITERTAAGFRLQLNGMPDSGNYYLHWAVSGVNILPVPATLYLFTGPTSSNFGVNKTFTVKLPPSTTVSVPITVTPDDGGLGGTFSPPTVTLSSGSASATFTYTAVAYGAATLSVTNSGTLADPTPIIYTSIAPTYTFTGPTTGDVGVASTNFTVQLLPGDATLAVPTTVTPSSGGGGGTFAPTSVLLVAGVPVHFTYTPASVGAKTISVTNNGGLANPANLTYTATTPGPYVQDTFTDTAGTPLPSHTMDIGTGWTRFEGGASNQMTISTTVLQSFMDAGNAYAYWTESSHANGTVSCRALFGTADASHYCQIVFRYSDASNWWTLRVNGSGASNVELVKKVAGVETVVGTGTLAVTAAIAYDFTVTLSGTSISVNAGGTILSTTDAFNQTATKHGLRSYQAGGNVNYFDDFQVTP